MPKYVFEGVKIIGEAIEEKANIKQIVICDNCQNANAIPYTRFIINKIPKNYVVQGYVNNNPYVVTTPGNIYFHIYEPDETVVLTRRLT